MISGVVFILLVATVEAQTKCPEPSLRKGKISASRVKYICDTGYTLKGNAIQTCNGGEWKEDMPVCQPNTCPRLTPPTNGGFAIHATFVCDKGYKLDTSNSSTKCLTTGKWSTDNASPKCTKIVCPSVLFPKGTVTLSLATRLPGTIMSFNCSTGFNREGASNVTCESAGLWNKKTPSCIKNTCKAVEPWNDRLQKCACDKNIPHPSSPRHYYPCVDNVKKGLVLCPSYRRWNVVENKCL